MGYLEVLLTAVMLAVILGLWKLFMDLIWRPYAITRHFAKQGIKGPSYSILTGSLKEIERLELEAKQKPMDPSSLDVTPKVLPHYHRWSRDYGETFLFWFGTQPRLSIVDPELIKEVLSTKFEYYTVDKPAPSVHALLGNGLLSLTGVDWVRHRRAVNPAFHVDKLKGMIKRMAACSQSTLDQWANEMAHPGGDQKDFDMHKEFMQLTGDIISHTSFGTSYKEGKEVFQVERELHHMVIESVTDVNIPGSEYLPTKWNRRMWKLEKRLRNQLRAIIESKLRMRNEGQDDFGDDLLGLMMSISEIGGPNKKAKMDATLTINEIIDECKTFFFAGHETTSNLLTWAMYFLSINQEWQEKLREEVASVCGPTKLPDADNLARLKLVTMVIFETLRLYSPVIFTERKAVSDLKLGNLMIPKDTVVTFPFPIIHRNKKYWGDDADEFNPLRFADGFSRAAKHPNALIAFSMGPRVCVGQNFAMLEAKTVLSMILQRFSFSLSPTYKHSPVNNILLQPEFGVPIIFKPLHM
ncbi:cytochrome P450 709B1-like [Magnolia sinica]|uniref:cytochrome P450 709B1-like n=1 Tax=Magnolia sinica TaxID=86752 RepID=UPI00265A5334|nr:cytochrome P450 709B1-like [Magnolia sinica]